MWLTLIAACVLTVILLLAKALSGRGESGVNLGHMSEQWLAENRNSHQ